MSDTPMPVTGFAMDAVESEDGQTIVAVLTLQTGEPTFEFAIMRMLAEPWPGTLNSSSAWWSRGAARSIDRCGRAT